MLQKKPSGLRKLILPIAIAGLLVLTVLALVVVGKPATQTPDAAKPDSKDPVPAQDVTALLPKLVVGAEGSMTGYSRDKFPHWDVNRPVHGFGDQFAQYSRCTTRVVMLLRDAVGSVRLDPKTCEFTVGTGGGWRDQYGVADRKTGELKPYKWVTDPSGMDADHIVPLAEAWRSGAAALDDETRRRIANDAINLVVSDPTANRSKGDQDPANYLPPGNFRCAYISRYVQVKVKYALTVDSAEQAALRTAVGDCARRGGFK
ncbi:HNH endonuclease family protein [Nocardia sp. NPDC088792]|uniref:HNH endonuclease family protein n=1 Tax=Nocardia sp. NPDC088792 TaxID=3364332 RepID=UPI00380CDDB1